MSILWTSNRGFDLPDSADSILATPSGVAGTFGAWSNSLGTIDVDSGITSVIVGTTDTSFGFLVVELGSKVGATVTPIGQHACIINPVGNQAEGMGMILSFPLGLKVLTGADIVAR